jgi:hypothetical protein
MTAVVVAIIAAIASLVVAIMPATMAVIRDRRKVAQLERIVRIMNDASVAPGVIKRLNPLAEFLALQVARELRSTESAAPYVEARSEITESAHEVTGETLEPTSEATSENELPFIQLTRRDIWQIYSYTLYRWAWVLAALSSTAAIIGVIMLFIRLR